MILNYYAVQSEHMKVLPDYLSQIETMLSFNISKNSKQRRTQQHYQKSDFVLSIACFDFSDGVAWFCGTSHFSFIYINFLKQLIQTYANTFGLFFQQFWFFIP